jgi:DNA-binding SARP family transcriptional activator/tetratricopeptide (TPR) repeat protein
VERRGHLAAEGLDIGGKLRAMGQRAFTPNQRGIITANVLRLRTFGGLWIESSDPSEAPAPPPRRLALLAVLAAAGPRGLSRDRLLGILWPEGSEERGRHALAQMVYSLRADLRSDGAIAGSSEVKLDPSIIASDVGDFAAAIARGDREAAARLYSGPFLDGFYLSEAPAFERWVEEERARLAAAAVVAVEQLALATGDIVWRRRLTELDPLRGRYAADYMAALAAAGDRAGALGHARSHERRVRGELEASPDAEVTRLANRLRAERADPAPPLPVTSAVPAPTATTPVTTATTSRGTRRARLAAMLVLALALAAFILWRSTNSPAVSGLPLLAVGTVRDGAGRDSTGSGAVLTDMLATSLARIRGLQVVANSRLLELVPRGTEAVPGNLSVAAREAGAAEILEGELVFAPDGGLRLELRRIDLKAGVVRQGYSVRAFDRYAAVDSATAAIAQDFGLSAPAKPIAEVSTSSPIAYRLYEEGLRAYYQYDVPAAYRLMNAALEEDSTFAMAAFYAWRSGISADPGSEPAQRARAVRLAPRAADRERLLILGMTNAQLEDPAALAPAESLAIRFPSDPDGQELYGLMQGARGEWARAAAALQRAIALDSAASVKPGAVCRACTSLHHLFDVYAAWDSMPAAERAVQAWIRLRPDAPEPWGILVQIRWRQERWDEADAALKRADSLSTRPGNPESRFRAALRRGSYDEVGKAAAVTLSDADPDRRVDARWVWLIALRNQGRLREAKALSEDRLTQSIVAFESGDYPVAISGFRAIAAAANTIPQPGHRARGVSWNLTHAAVAYAASGDTAAVRRLADSVEAIGPQSLFGRSARLHYFLRGLLLAAGGRHAEALESYRRAMFSATEGYTRINYEMAKSLLALKRPGEALAPLQAALRGGIDGSTLYITRTELHELLAQAFAAAGQRDSAAVHYREVMRAWERGDPPFQLRRKAAERWLAANRG